MKRAEIAELAFNYHQYLIDFAMRMTNNEELAKDTVQDTYLRLMVQPNIDVMVIDTRTFCGYLRQLVTWQLRHNYKKSKAENTSSIDALPGYGKSIRNRCYEDAAYTTFELQAIIDTAIKRTVPKSMRKTIRMRYVKDMSYKEIGKKLKINHAAAQVRCSKWGKGVREAVEFYMSIK